MTFRQAGFTLIELIVVIVVIMILFLILWPVNISSKSPTQQTLCLSNLKQLSTAGAIYAADYDNHTLPATNGMRGANVKGGWIYYSQFSATFEPSKGVLSKYVESIGIYICFNDLHKSSHNSYALNSCVTDQASVLAHGKNIAVIKAPESLALLVEGVSGDPAKGSTDDGFLRYPLALLSTRHNQKSNLSFVDTHVKSLKPEDALARGFIYGAPGLTKCE